MGRSLVFKRYEIFLDAKDSFRDDMRVKEDHLSEIAVLQKMNFVTCLTVNGD